MECILQWLDEIDDAVSMAASQAELLRRLFLSFIVGLAGFSVLLGAAALALVQPPVAPIAASILLSCLVYRHQQRSPAHPIPADAA